MTSNHVLFIMVSMLIMIISLSQAQRFTSPIEYVGRNREWGISFLNNTPNFEIFATTGEEVSSNSSDPNAPSVVTRLDEYMQFVLAGVRERTSTGAIVFSQDFPLLNCPLARNCFWEITTDTSYGTNSPTHSVRFRGFFILKGSIIIETDIYDDRSSRQGLGATNEGIAGTSEDISSGTSSSIGGGNGGFVVPGQTVAVRMSLRDWTWETNDTSSVVEIVFNTAFNNAAGNTSTTTPTTPPTTNTTEVKRQAGGNIAERESLGDSTSGLISINQNALIDGQLRTAAVDYESQSGTVNVPYFTNNATYDGIYFTIYTPSSGDGDDESSSGIGASGGIVIAVVLGVLCLLAILALIIFVLILLFGKKVVDKVQSRRVKDNRT